MTRKKARIRLIACTLFAAAVVTAATAVLHGPTGRYLHFVWAFKSAPSDVPGVVAYEERTTGARWWLFEPRVLPERNSTSVSSAGTMPDLLEAYSRMTGSALLLQQDLFPPRPQPGHGILIGLPDGEFLAWFTTRTFTSPSQIRRQLKDFGAVFTAVHNHRYPAMQVRFTNPAGLFVENYGLPSGLVR